MSKYSVLVVFLFAIHALCHAVEEKLIVLNQGMWQADNGRLSYFADGQIISNEWFREVNGYKLGDTPNDIITVNEDLIAIAVNWSNIIQFMTPEGRAVGAIEDIPNVRCLASDGEYVYATSYGHECKTATGCLYFEKGFVAKIDTRTFTITDACETGYEPEGIACHNNCLYIANSGGYAFQEGHDYEQTVTIIDSGNMEKIGEIDTGHINLYGKMSKSGKYLCINSAGDYYETPGCGIILDCEKALSNSGECFISIPYYVTYNCNAGDGLFYAVGAGYSYLTGEYEFNCITLDAQKIMDSKGEEGITLKMPGNMAEMIMGMEAPYGIYMNPYTRMLYATDAGSFSGSGQLYQWDPDGNFKGKHAVYINPGGFMALPPDSQLSEITALNRETSNGIYDILGRRVIQPDRGVIYIRNGKKVIFK